MVNHGGYGLGAGVLLGAVLMASPAAAATFNVGTGSDTHDAAPGNGVCRDSSNRCSLRAAIEEANALNNYSTINVSARTYTLNPAANFGQLLVAGSMQITGAGASTTIINGAGLTRVMQINSGEVTLSRLKFQNGNGKPNRDGIESTRPGGSLRVSGGLVFVTESVITTTMSIVDKPFPGAGVSAGGGMLQLIDTTVSNNQTPTGISGGVQHTGGGLFVFLGANVGVFSSTFTGNLATRGGAIGVGGGDLLVDNSTISGNQTDLEGGAGVYAAGTGYMSIAYSTITNNSITNAVSDFRGWGAGIRVYGGTLHLAKALVTGNSDGRNSSSAQFSPDCGVDDVSSPPSGILSYDDNFVGTWGNKCLNYTGAHDGAYDWLGWASVSLGPLANNGGLTLTHKLLGGDPVDSYSGTGAPPAEWGFPCPFEDQTHLARPRDGNQDGIALCDTGASEL